MSMTLDEFRKAKESGVDLYAQEAQQEVVDAAQQEVVVDETEAEETEQQELPAESEETSEVQEVDDSEDETIPQEQKNAFYKRVQRERKKAQEEAETRLRAEFDTQLNPYKAFFDSLGITPEQAMQQVQTNKLQQEAQQLAYTNGWTDQEAQMYVEQQQLKAQQLDNSVALRVYELSDTADYPGIKGMKGSITEFIRNNPRTSVEQAYWAVGGSSLAQQLKREAEQREVAKRSQTKRTVVTGNEAAPTGPAPLPAEAVQFMKETGMSEKAVRAMLNDEVPKNVDDYIKWKQGRK